MKEYGLNVNGNCQLPEIASHCLRTDARKSPVGYSNFYAGRAMTQQAGWRQRPRRAMFLICWGKFILSIKSLQLLGNIRTNSIIATFPSRIQQLKSRDEASIFQKTTINLHRCSL